VLLIKTWDSPGVIPASRAVGEALEHPALIRWDPNPLDPKAWAKDMAWQVERSRLRSIGKTTTHARS